MTVTLSLWDKKSLFFVNGELPAHVTDELKQSLRYRDPDAQWSDAYKTGAWDGYVSLFRQADNGNWFFPIGLLPKVAQILRYNSIDFDIDGLARPGRGEMPYEWHAEGITLRDYQREAIDTALAEGGGLIVMPTGAGKTLTGLAIMRELRLPAIVLCHTVEIAEQWCTRIRDRLGVEPARYFGGDHEAGDVMVALYQSIYQDGEVRDDVHLGHPVALFDEAHRVAAGTFEQVALACAAVWRFGFSATPEREDNATLKIIGGVGERICDVSVESLIREGYLAEPRWRFLEPKPMVRSPRDWQNDYQYNVVENNDRNELIAETVAELTDPTLVTVERINHGQRLEALIDGSEFVHGDDADRADKLERFRGGDMDVLIATRGIVGEGFDVPEIASFVVAGGLKSSTSMIQQVGRALRPDTAEATIVDCIDTTEWTGKHAEQRLRTYRDYYGEFGP